MRKYLVNSTYCIYLSGINHLYFDNTVFTIKEVADEVKYELKMEKQLPVVQTKKANLAIKSESLSKTDVLLLETAKALDYVIVSDDRKIVSTAHENRIRPLDTPHFIHVLVIEGKWTKEKAVLALKQLKQIYNRNYVIDKVMKDIENWG